MSINKHTNSPLTAILIQGVSTTHPDRTEAARRFVNERPRLVNGEVSA